MTPSKHDHPITRMPKYKFAIPLTILLLLVGTASASFELKDPAAEIYENTPAKVADYLAAKACFDFLLDGAKDMGTYKADLVRIRDYVLDGGANARAIPDEARLREFCIDNPKIDLRQAVDTLVRDRV